MKKIITVCTLDTNRFFVQGVQHILVPHFQRQGQGVCFVDEQEAARADLVFRSVSKSWPVQLCLPGEPAKPVAPVFIALRATQGDKTNKCLREQGSLWRCARPRALLALVEQGLRTQNEPMPLLYVAVPDRT